ncbi:alternative ribosome rescue aminoacyl-tRNA hydrolase ArfB [Dokdonia sp. Hel_I_53]|uniref:alternative ribosome rescue aminoacyl-tRNA hydrolase ArfB n=1 Tax=Dokdonia sp. Hel_I_53 TaxID=1566287 RepID=UPI00119A569F|nr:alternative ribosome rescue aminoacyl-tRNA hydrolase ArfB [Dokdonia sp. Hel_I_53]TVZ52729.1 ribosome-associated protein [Dokdonia sp. Hel_I_53]
MNKKQLLSELHFKATRSSGAGGQHVNKTSSRVELSWNTSETEAFTNEELVRIKEKLSHRITKNGLLQLSSEASRSQHRNKEEVINRFFGLLEVAIVRPKVRKKRRPSKVAKLKRLMAKKQQAEKKQNRKKPTL